MNSPKVTTFQHDETFMILKIHQHVRYMRAICFILCRLLCMTQAGYDITVEGNGTVN